MACLGFKTVILRADDASGCSLRRWNLATRRQFRLVTTVLKSGCSRLHLFGPVPGKKCLSPLPHLGIAVESQGPQERSASVISRNVSQLVQSKQDHVSVPGGNTALQC